MQPLLQTFCPLGMLKIVFRDSSLYPKQSRAYTREWLGVNRSGVFKGRRARHLPRAPPWGITRINFPHFWWKTYYSLTWCATKQITSKYFAFKGPLYRNCDVQVLCFQRGPNSNWNMYVLCRLTSSKGPRKETVVCKYSTFKGAPNSKCYV